MIKINKTLAIVLLAFVVGLLIFGVISAEVQSIPPVKTGTCTQLPQSYFNSTFQNISSIQRPDKNYLTFNKEMQNRGGGLYNFTFCNTTQTGTYIINGFGDKDGIIETWVYDFEVTPSGSIFNLSQTIPLLFPLLLMVIVAVVFIFVARLVERPEIKYSFFIMAIGFIVIGIVFGIIAFNEIFYGFSNILSFMGSFTNIFILVVPVSVFILVLVIVIFVLKRVFSAKGYFTGGAAK